MTLGSVSSAFPDPRQGSIIKRGTETCSLQVDMIRGVADMFKGRDPLPSCVIAPAPRNQHRRSDSLKHFKLFFSFINNQTNVNRLIITVTRLTGTRQTNKTLMGEIHILSKRLSREAR